MLLSSLKGLKGMLDSGCFFFFLVVVLLSGHSNFHLLQWDKSGASCGSLCHSVSAANVNIFKTIYIKNVNKVNSCCSLLTLIIIFLFNFAKGIIIISIQSDNMKHLYFEV